MKNIFLYLAFISVTLFSCEESFSPKPKGFNRIDLPPHEYKKLEEDHPYTFEHSIHAKVLKDTSYIAEPHWIDLYYPQFHSNIQITYKSIPDEIKNSGGKGDLAKDKKKLIELINDSYKLKSGHLKKARSVEESVLNLKNGMSATVFELEGEVPSQFQFYITDSTQHFLRGALYFRTSLKNDSLEPVINYMKEDIIHLMNTLEWK